MCDKYWFEHGKLFELNDEQNAWIFVGCFSAKTKAGAIDLHQEIELRKQEEIQR